MSENYISAIIVAYDAEKTIKRSIESLLYQDYPKDSYEVIFVDGMSNDNTMEIAKSILANSNVSYQLIKNEKRNLASGWNLGIQNAKGEYVVRIDAHVVAHENFLSKSMQTLDEKSDVVCVGGRAITIVEGKYKDIISNVLSSPFGVGNSTFRVSDTKQYADTAACGLYKKSIFEQVGYFDDTLDRSQDTEMHARIAKAGGKFYFNPEIKLDYYARNTMKGVIKQAYGNGKWNIAVWKKNKQSLMIRHLVPLFFVLSIISISIGSCFSSFARILFIIEGLLYFTLASLSALIKTKNIVKIVNMVMLFFTMHIAYGLGSLHSFINYRKI